MDKKSLDIFSHGYGNFTILLPKEILDQICIYLFLYVSLLSTIEPYFFLIGNMIDHNDYHKIFS